jgi:threonine dehydrogenase-like Zn-dependent dehydrogenase
VPDPEPPPEGVVVRISATALCGSELPMYRAATVREGVTNLGHEATGVVVDASRSRRWNVGDRVGIHAVWGCGECTVCQRGAYTACDAHRVRMGMHAELVAAPDHVLLPLPDDVDFGLGCLLTGDTLGVPFHASKRLGIAAGETVAVVGCGPVGLASILFHTHAGARVVALEPGAARRERALALGAAAAIHPGELQAVARARDALDGQLPAAVIEASGTPQGVALALSLAAKGGRVALCGETGPVAVDVSRDLLRPELTLFGCWYYAYAEYADMVRVVRQGLRLDRLISHRFPFREAPAAVDTFARGDTCKVVIELGD